MSQKPKIKIGRDTLFNILPKCQKKERFKWTLTYCQM